MTVNRVMSSDIHESSPAFENIPISAAISSTIPHIIAILSEALTAADVMSSADNFGHSLSEAFGGSLRNGAESSAAIRFVPATASITGTQAPLQSGAAIDDTAIMYAGPGAMQKQRYSSACSFVSFPLSYSPLISAAPTGYPASWLMMKTGKKSSGSRRIYLEKREKGLPRSLYASVDISSFEAAVNAKREGIRVEMHSAAAFAHSAAHSRPAHMRAAAKAMAGSAGSIFFADLIKSISETVLCIKRSEI